MTQDEAIQTQKKFLKIDAQENQNVAHERGIVTFKLQIHANGLIIQLNHNEIKNENTYQAEIKELTEPQIQKTGNYSTDQLDEPLVLTTHIASK